MDDRAQREAFDRIWQAFRASPTLVDGRHDTESWRGRSGPFALAVIRVPADLLQPYLDLCRERLAAFPFVRLHPDGFLHITLQELGFVCDDPEAVDEISAVRLEEFAQAAVGPVADREPFPVTIGGVNSFEDAVFLEVHDDGSSAALHARLFELAAIPRATPFAYVPHLTIAHYTGSGDPGTVAESLGPERSVTFGSFTVEAVEIVTLDVAETYPALRPYAIIPLGG